MNPSINPYQSSGLNINQAIAQQRLDSQSANLPTDVGAFARATLPPIEKLVQSLKNLLPQRARVTGHAQKSNSKMASNHIAKVLSSTLGNSLEKANDHVES